MRRKSSHRPRKDKWMTSRRFWQCGRKRKFWSHDAAQAIADILPKPGRVYGCDWCNGFHIATKREGK